MDTGANLKWSSVMVGASPCLTATGCASEGHYITQRCRMMALSDMRRLQGLPPNRIHYGKAKVSRTEFARAMGNMMSVSVLQRLLKPLLKSASRLREGTSTMCPTSSRTACAHGPGTRTHTTKPPEGWLDRCRTSCTTMLGGGLTPPGTVHTSATMRQMTCFDANGKRPLLNDLSVGSGGRGQATAATALPSPVRGG